VAQSLYQDPRITTDNGKGDPGKIVEISQEWGKDVLYHLHFLIYT
jgi:hypothetical protein